MTTRTQKQKNLKIRFYRHLDKPSSVFNMLVQRVGFEPTNPYRIGS